MSSHCLPLFPNVTIDPKHYFFKKKRGWGMCSVTVEKKKNFQKEVARLMNVV